MKVLENNKEIIVKIHLSFIKLCVCILFFISLAIGISPEFRSLGTFNEHNIWASGVVFGMLFIPFMNEIVTPILQNIVHVLLKKR